MIVKSKQMEMKELMAELLVKMERMESMKMTELLTELLVKMEQRGDDGDDGADEDEDGPLRGVAWLVRLRYGCVDAFRGCCYDRVRGGCKTVAFFCFRFILPFRYCATFPMIF